MKNVYYPTFEFTSAEKQGVIPVVRVPKNYEELLEGFYRSGGKGKVEKYVGKWQELSGNKILLRWEHSKGLTDIAIPNGHCGLQLNEQGFFQEQNLNFNWKNCFICGAVAQKYVSELFRIRDL
jgi:hypothetical protein